MKNDEIARLWDFWAQGGAATSVPITRFDNRGHGQSSDDTDWTNFTWEGVSKDMQALADAELVDGARLVVGGASMGAGGALWLAATHPERVAALIMVIPPTCYETRVSRAAQLAQLKQQPYHEYISKTRPPKARPPYKSDSSERIVRSKGKRTPGIREASFVAVYEGSEKSDYPSKEDIVANVTMPVLILGWDCKDDPSHPASSVELLKDLLPHAEVHLATYMDDVRKWPDTIGDFILRL